MSLTQEQKNIALQLLIEKSCRNLDQAVKVAELGYWDLVANRLYYSIFHAVTALMLFDGIQTKSHKGTSAQFGKYYILTGRFPREAGILYSRLQTMREKADYQNVFILPEEEGVILIEEVKMLQASIIEECKGGLKPKD
ncbi:MAG: HEPN domain-containing protein [Muribaculaceae bacterium]|nr:HEPN domain-containing protein [Muribaculaceae bacterium]